MSISISLKYSLILDLIYTFFQSMSLSSSGRVSWRSMELTSCAIKMSTILLSCAWTNLDVLSVSSREWSLSGAHRVAQLFLERIYVRLERRNASCLCLCKETSRSFLTEEDSTSFPSNSVTYLFVSFRNYLTVQGQIVWWLMDSWLSPEKSTMAVFFTDFSDVNLMGNPSVHAFPELWDYFPKTT